MHGHNYARTHTCTHAHTHGHAHTAESTLRSTHGGLCIFSTEILENFGMVHLAFHISGCPVVHKVLELACPSSFVCEHAISFDLSFLLFHSKKWGNHLPVVHGAVIVVGCSSDKACCTAATYSQSQDFHNTTHSACIATTLLHKWKNSCAVNSTRWLRRSKRQGMNIRTNMQAFEYVTFASFLICILRDSATTDALSSMSVMSGLETSSDDQTVCFLSEMSPTTRMHSCLTHPKEEYMGSQMFRGNRKKTSLDFFLWRFSSSTKSFSQI